MIINRQSLKIMRPRIVDALKELGKELDINFDIGNARFSRTGDNAVFKLELSTIGDGGEVNSEDVENFKIHCFRWGLKETDLGETFKAWSGKSYKIIGANPRRYKNPILCESLESGKEFIFPANEVKAHLDRRRSEKQL